jgi:hypothetical protein
MASTALQYMSTSRFWFESFHNWQSEFLAVAVLVGAPEPILPERKRACERS